MTSDENELHDKIQNVRATQLEAKITIEINCLMPRGSEYICVAILSVHSVSFHFTMTVMQM